MPDFTPERLRNVALLSHSGAGKTSIAEALLFATGATTRMGRIEDGNTTSDYEPEEVQARGQHPDVPGSLRLEQPQGQPH